jgi:hypothetical protein
MEATSSPEMPVSYHITTWHHNPVDIKFNVQTKMGTGKDLEGGGCELRVERFKLGMSQMQVWSVTATPTCCM